VKVLPFICLVFLFACSKHEETPQATLPKVACPTNFYTPFSGNKAIITYTAPIKHGDWIEIDNLGKAYHLLDTSYSFENFELNSLIRLNYPFYRYDINFLWISDSYVRSISDGNQRWYYNFTSLGLPAYSLSLYLVGYRRVAYLFDDKRSNSTAMYSISYGCVEDAATWWFYDLKVFDNGRYFDKLNIVVLERTDGKPIKIQTSPNYGAKIAYQ
jgi:hypothetical protein